MKIFKFLNWNFEFWPNLKTKTEPRNHGLMVLSFRFFVTVLFKQFQFIWFRGRFGLVQVSKFLNGSILTPSNQTVADCYCYGSWVHLYIALKGKFPLRFALWWSLCWLEEWICTRTHIMLFSALWFSPMF